MDINQITKWLSFDFSSLPSGADLNPLTKFNLSSTPVGTIYPRAEFFVPNTVLAYWGGELKTFGRFWVNWATDATSLLRKGYYVDRAGYKSLTRSSLPRPTNDPAGDAREMRRIIERDFSNGPHVDDPWNADRFREYVRDGTSGRDLYGLYFWGHGGPEGLLLNSKNPTQADVVFYDDLKNDESYRLGVGLLYACFSDNAKSKALFTGAVFWGSQTVMVFPLLPPLVQKLSREVFTGYQLGIGEYKVTMNPPSVSNVLSKSVGIK